MSQSLLQRQKASYQAALDRTLLRSVVAGLVPKSRRGRTPILFRLAALVLWVIGLWGLPVAWVILCLVVAMAIEALDYYRQQRALMADALARPSLWDRVRPQFYWPLTLGLGLVSFLHAQEALTISVLRAIFQWLCLRSIEDSYIHPERYNSLEGFLNWLQGLGQYMTRLWGIGFSFLTLIISGGFALNLVAPGIWTSVGNTGWSRLLAFGCGLYLLAMLAFVRAAGSTIRSEVRESVQDWDGLAFKDMDRVLRSTHFIPGTEYDDLRYREQIKQRLSWKQVDSLLDRVVPELIHSLTQRLRWGGFLASLLVFAVAASFLFISAFSIVPRNVMVEWASAGQTDEKHIFLAFDDSEDLPEEGFLEQFSEMDWSDVAQEPLPKIAFLEAAVIVSLVLLRAASDRAALKKIADTDPWNLYRWLLLGTAYLILLEEEFQYLYNGFVTRQLTTIRAIAMQNDVLLAPSVATRASVYRAISGFLRLYEPQAQQPSPYVLAVFASYRLAQAWTLTFVRFSSLTMQRPEGLDQNAPPEPEWEPARFWIWSGEQLVGLTGLEEGERYGRFVAR